jgi:glutamine synthetase
MKETFNLSYFIKPELIEPQYIIEFFSKNPNVRFVSLFGVDIMGHDTDEKIPRKNFLDKLDDIFKDKPFLQTDGSSIALSALASLSDCKVDMVADRKSTWYVDYNFENMDEETLLPVGTLRIPAFLLHNGNPIGARSLLKKGYEIFQANMMKYIVQSAYLQKQGISGNIASVNVNIGTELEFWVKTPTVDAEVDQLRTTQEMQENYWQRTKGSVRTALENALLLLDKYGLEPEMGHKEVGGVKASIDKSGDLDYVMEQIEVDWKYSSNPLEAADKELLARITIKETFRRYGLECSFMAKPIDNVAGNGEHIHIGAGLKMENGNSYNLFSPAQEKSYLNTFGYGALMGILNNYDIISPYISASTDALNRLKPNFEAPVSAVCSLGEAYNMPSRNRTVLVGLISDLENEFARRFELRAANPHTNLYIAISAIMMCMLEGIDYTVNSEKSEAELLDEVSKKGGEFKGYLKEAYVFRAENNIFKDFTDAERLEMFGPSPRTVYEVMKPLLEMNGKNPFIHKVFSEHFVSSYSDYMLERWMSEILERLMPVYLKGLSEIRRCEDEAPIDVYRWNDIENIMKKIYKDTETEVSLRTGIYKAASAKDFKTLSDLFLELKENWTRLMKSYKEYRNNFI